jgi:hypothetical protein
MHHIPRFNGNFIPWEEQQKKAYPFRGHTNNNNNHFNRGERNNNNVKIFSREYLEQRGMIMMNITNCKNEEEEEEEQ